MSNRLDVNIQLDFLSMELLLLVGQSKSSQSQGHGSQLPKHFDVELIKLGDRVAMGFRVFCKSITR